MTIPFPRPEFVTRDPAAIESEMVATYESLVGRRLQPGQVERQLIAVLAYRETLVRTAVQDAAEQNLVAYARYPMLDLLGEIVGVVRLDAQPAQALFRFTLSAPLGAAVAVPVGTRVQTADGALVFATDAMLTIAAGDTTGDIDATATTAGARGNGYLAGQATTLIDAVSYVASVANVATSRGGADQETDDRLRERIRQAPEGFSVAGSKGAYRYRALSVSAAIIDVAVTSPTPGNVRVDVLTSSGAPSDELLAAVLAALSDDKVRPLTDTVTVGAPTERDYAITATIEILRGAQGSAVLELANAAATAYVADRAGGLGRDVVPSQVISALSVAGTYRVVLTEPAYMAVGDGEWANCTGIVLTMGATYDG